MIANLIQERLEILRQERQKVIDEFTRRYEAEIRIAILPYDGAIAELTYLLDNLTEENEKEEANG